MKVDIDKCILPLLSAPVCDAEVAHHWWFIAGVSELVGTRSKWAETEGRQCSDTSSHTSQGLCCWIWETLGATQLRHQNPSGVSLLKGLQQVNRCRSFRFMCYSACFGVICMSSARSHTSGEQTSQEVKKEVEQHLKEKERLERSLPSSIVIGPFFVRVEAVRQALSNKRKALAKTMLDHLAVKLRKQIDDVSHFFRGSKHFIWL